MEKKIVAISHKHAEVKSWIKSITGHLYWSAASTPSHLEEKQKQNIVIAKRKTNPTYSMLIVNEYSFNFMF